MGMEFEVSHKTKDVERVVTQYIIILLHAAAVWLLSVRICHCT